MCVANKQFELLEFVFDSVYVDLQYEDISLTFFWWLYVLELCLWSCGRLWSVYEVVVVPYVDPVVTVTVMRVLVFVLHACLLRECDGVKLTAMLVWGMYEVWRVRGMWVVHVVHVLCLAHLTYYGWVWCVGCEELVRCVCIWLGRRVLRGVSGWEDGVWAIAILWEQGECWTYVCGGVSGVGVEWVGGLDQGLEGWGGVMSVWVVSMDFLCIWQIQVYVYCVWRIPAHLRCTQCSILLHLMDICFLTCICL